MGTVKKWFSDKGYGFISPEDGSGDLFVHFKHIEEQSGERRTTLNIGENVTYTIGTNPKTGNPAAENVIGDKTGTPTPARGAYGFGRGRGFGRGVGGWGYGGAWGRGAGYMGAWGGGGRGFGGAAAWGGRRR